MVPKHTYFGPPCARSISKFANVCAMHTHMRMCIWLLSVRIHYFRHVNTLRRMVVLPYSFHLRVTFSFGVLRSKRRMTSWKSLNFVVPFQHFAVLVYAWIRLDISGRQHTINKKQSSKQKHFSRMRSTFTWVHCGTQTSSASRPPYQPQLEPRIL